jgi:hypothetical protein
LLFAGQLTHYLLGRRRLAAWDAEWRATGPQQGVGKVLLDGG